MKVFEVLNELYKGKYIEIENVLYKIEEFNKKYFLVNVASGFYQQNIESILLKDVNLVLSDEEKFNDIAKKDIIIRDKEFEDILLTVTSNYQIYKDAKYRNDNIYIGIEGRFVGGAVSISFEEFDKIAKYVDNLRELLER